MRSTKLIKSIIFRIRFSPNSIISRLHPLDGAFNYFNFSIFTLLVAFLWVMQCELFLFTNCFFICFSLLFVSENQRWNSKMNEVKKKEKCIIRWTNNYLSQVRCFGGDDIGHELCIPIETKEHWRDSIFHAIRN